MATKSDDVNSSDADLNLKKRRTTANNTTRGDLVDPVRRTILAAGEFHRGIAEAVAEALRSFNAELDTKRGADEDLTGALFDGVAEGHAKFHEAMADTSRETAKHLRVDREDRTMNLAEEIDYERLARLVAAELKKSGTGVSLPSDKKS